MTQLDGQGPDPAPPYRRLEPSWDEEARTPPLSERRRVRRRKKGHHVRVLVVLLCLFGILGLASLAGAGVVGTMLAADTASSVYDRCSNVSLEAAPLPQNSFVFAADGSPLGSIPTSENREPVTLRQMSPWLPKALVAIEDRRFFEHRGVDPEGIARAAVANARRGGIAEGGSTITQQLVRNLLLGDASPTVRRKLEEACLALRLEEEWPKAKILARYLNHVSFGNQAHGAQAAARIYFSKPASKLTLAEAALLAGLPQAPSTYDPFLRPRAALARRTDVLDAMLRQGVITAKRYRNNVDKPLGLRRGGDRYRIIREPGFFEWIRREVASEYGLPLVRAGGLRIETTLDMRLQQLAYEAILSNLRTPGGPASAVVSIDPRRGAVKAMAAAGAGGRRYNYNLAWQGRRQTGSAFKVFTLAAAIEGGGSLNAYLEARDVIDDPRCLTNGTEPWEVEGGEGGTLEEATVQSSNRAYATLVTRVGPQRVVSMAYRLGITSPLRPVCSITLGTESVSPLELTTAYATLAARGVRRDPHGIGRVRTRPGAVIGKTEIVHRRALRAEVADTVTQALRAVVERGTGTPAAVPGFAVAGKTGTTDNHWDAWFCGYVSQLATCVWVGYPAGQIPLLNVEGVPVVFGGTIPATIWRDFMTPALTGERPSGSVAPRTETAPADELEGAGDE